MRTVWTVLELSPALPVQYKFAENAGGQLFAARGEVGVTDNFALLSFKVLIALATLVHAVRLKLVLEIAIKIILGEVRVLRAVVCWRLVFSLFDQSVLA